MTDSTNKSPPPEHEKQEKAYKQEKEKYNEMQLNFYKDNQVFLDKTILGVSALAIPFLFIQLTTTNFKSAPHLSTYPCLNIIFLLCLCFSLLGFFAVICLHIKALKIAKKACDERMSNDEEICKRGDTHAGWAELIDTWRDTVFTFSLSLIIIALFAKTISGFFQRGI